jgi:hypothetical protein
MRCWRISKDVPISDSTIRTLGERLDDLIINLRPCFVLGEPTSILQVFYDSTPTRPDSWNHIHDVLNVLGAWFRGWDGIREAVGPNRTPQVLIQQIQSLNDFLTYLGMTLPEVRKIVIALPEGHHAYLLYKVTADRFNHFLTEYEAWLRRLPDEVRIPRPPIAGTQHFFIRF